jgi:hypothetical protein
LVSPGIDKASSIATNTIPVPSRYHHDTVLTFFCLSGIIAVPILAIFPKPSMLILYYNATTADMLNEETFGFKIFTFIF